MAALALLSALLLAVPATPLSDDASVLRLRPLSVQLPPLHAPLATCPPDDARARGEVRTFLAGQSATTVSVRAQAGLAGASPNEVVVVTDPAACAFIAGNLRGNVDDPDYLYVFYRHAPTGRIITVRIVRHGVRGPDEHGDYSILLSGSTVSVYTPSMEFIAGVNY